MSYRYMRLILFFDLPRETAKERKVAADFRKRLVKEGFLMLQESVYCKLTLNMTGMKLLKERIGKFMPRKGSVMMLTVTEKQFGDMDICCGERRSEVEDSDKNLIII